MIEPAFHPWPGLLSMSSDEILNTYRKSQLTDILSAFALLGRRGSTLIADIDILERYFAAFPNEELLQRLQLDTIQNLFKELHDHVMRHPVWIHPVFRRFVEGNVTYDQLRLFAQHYFNQVKNTRQCVALALGRFHTLLPYTSETSLGVILSELTQMVLARLLADEYGLTEEYYSSAGGAKTSAVDIKGLFTPVTHPGLYRRFLAALGVVVSDYDVPLLHSVADNVLVQRIISGHPEFDYIEALASVGLGMEWGVPAFFSMLISGIVKVFRDEGLPLDAKSTEIWSAHVQQDVSHAVAVMLVTSFFVRGREDIESIKGVTNALMAFRFEMMSDIYEEVFKENCTRIDQIGLRDQYLIPDARLRELLPAMRVTLNPRTVRNFPQYCARVHFPNINIAAAAGTGGAAGTTSGAASMIAV